MFVGKCRIILGIFMIFMQFFGAFLGAVYAKCILPNSEFAASVHAAMKCSDMEMHAPSRLQVQFS